MLPITVCSPDCVRAWANPLRAFFRAAVLPGRNRSWSSPINEQTAAIQG